MMKRLLFVSCGGGSVVALVAAFLGHMVALKTPSITNFAVSGVISLLAISLLLGTREIWERRESLYRVMRWFWLLAFAISIYTILLAACRHVILDKDIADSTAIDWKLIRSADFSQQLMVFVLVAFFVGAPIAFSYLCTPWFQAETPKEPRRLQSTSTQATTESYRKS